MQPTGFYGFGPFEFDARARRLLCAGQDIALTDRQASLLLHLVTRAGAVIPKDELVAFVWGDVAVTDNSLEQMVSSLRKLLRDAAGGQSYVETVPRRGYRLAIDVRRLAHRESDEDLDAWLAPHRAWIEGRAALETLDQNRIAQARAAFEGVVARVPDMAAAHVGLANACVMRFETTRTDEAPDYDALASAVTHAREACRLDPALAEAWATLGFVLARPHSTVDALAASRRAVTLEPDNWRHQLRLASVGWGEERLRAARRTLALLPGFPLAHWLAATVHVARQALDEAARELDAGIAAARGRPDDEPQWSAVTLHGLRGLIDLSRGETDDAIAAFKREIALDGNGHLYVRESVARAHYALGACHLRMGHRAEAARAFQDALRRAPGLALARVGLGAIEIAPVESGLSLGVGGLGAMSAPSENTVDAALGMAIGLSAIRLAVGDRSGGHASSQLAGVAAFVEQALATAGPGSAGWILPIEPLIDVGSSPELWTPALARLRARAS